MAAPAPVAKKEEGEAPDSGAEPTQDNLDDKVGALLVLAAAGACLPSRSQVSAR